MHSPTEKPVWLARALSRAGIFPLAEAEAAISGGRVKVNAKVVTEPFAPVPADAVVKVDGKPVSLVFETQVLMFHKPTGVVTSTVDPEGMGTVFDALFKVLPPDLRGFGWHAVGRLDRNTTGLLLFTNDEKLVAHVTHPSTHLPKRYIATVLGQVTDEKLQPLRDGIELHDGRTRPAQAVMRGPHTVELTLTEGKNHQVKRMLGAVGLPVTHLHRSHINNLSLNVDLGTCRLLDAREISEGLGYAPSSHSNMRANKTEGNDVTG